MDTIRINLFVGIDRLVMDVGILFDKTVAQTTLLQLPKANAAAAPTFA